MKKILVMAAAIAAFGFADCAQAAPPAPFSWTGFYIGATAGFASTKADVSLDTVNGAFPLYDPSQIPGLNAIGSPSIAGSNAIFGAKLGYNQQWGSFVLGLEGDFSSFRFNKSAMTTGNPFDIVLPPATPNVANFNTSVSTKWLATVRPRFGYAADQALFYATRA